MTAVPTFERRPVPMTPLARPATMRQLEVLDWIRTYIAKNGVSPTLREIGTGVGIRSTNGVNDHLRALERRGLIVCADLKTRSIQLVEPVAGAKEDVVKRGGASDTPSGTTDSFEASATSQLGAWPDSFRSRLGPDGSCHSRIGSGRTGVR